MKRKNIICLYYSGLIIAGVVTLALCKGEKEKYEGMRVQETPLQQFIGLSADSSYLIFVFIPSCKYCQNSVANLNEYEKTGVADRVIGLTVKDSIGEQYFRQHYKPAFRIMGCDAVKLLEFNNRFPTSYYIENNVIEKIFRGELPEGREFFKKSKSKTKTEQC